MLRPIDGEGMSRYSAGRPGWENAPAVADPPPALMRPVSMAAPAAAIASLRGVVVAALRSFATKFIFSPHPNFLLPLVRWNLFWASETQLADPTRLSWPRG